MAGVWLECSVEEATWRGRWDGARKQTPALRASEAEVRGGWRKAHEVVVTTAAAGVGSPVAAAGEKRVETEAIETQETVLGHLSRHEHRLGW